MYSRLQVAGGLGGEPGIINLLAAATPSAGNTGVGIIQFRDPSGNLGASINAESDAAWTSGSSHPSRLVFSTTPDGSSSPTTSPPAMTIKSSQEVLIGTSTITANGGILQLKSGITFPATAVAASDANTLDDYEEGTWTPTQGAGLTVVGTFSSGGLYIKVGRKILITGYIAGSASVTAAAGAILCEGLPFNAVGGIATAIGSGSNAGLSALINILVNGGTDDIYAVTTMAATTFIYFAASYIGA